MARIYWFPLAAILCVNACAIAPLPPQHPTPAVAKSPPPDRVEVIPPAPSANDFWIKGYWNLEDGTQAWVPGHWEAKRPGWHWVPAHWGMPGEQWEFIAGHWEPN